MHRLLKNGRAALVALALGATGVGIAGAAPASAAPSDLLDYCALSVSWHSGGALTGSGTCLDDLVSEAVTINGYAPANDCSDFLFDMHGYTGRPMSRWATGTGDVANALASLLPGGAPSVRGGSIYNYGQRNGGYNGTALFVGTEHCVGGSQFLQGTLIISPA